MRGIAHGPGGGRDDPTVVENVKDAIQSIASGGPAGCLAHRMPSGWITGEITTARRWDQVKLFLGAALRGDLRISITRGSAPRDRLPPATSGPR